MRQRRSGRILFCRTAATTARTGWEICGALQNRQRRRRNDMSRRAVPWFLVGLCLWTTVRVIASAAEPLALHPDNPHYFLFRGKPTILITSGEHYGAVLN